MKSKWSIKEYAHFNKTGQSPEEATASVKKAERFVNMKEKEFQSTSEQWLMHRGYLRLTPDNAAKKPLNQRGWQAHLFNARKNPLFPDLMLFDVDMEYSLMIELKVRDVYQPGQREMIARGSWNLALSFGDVESLVKGWEAKLSILKE